MDFGVDPRAMDTMSLPEIDEMLTALAKRHKKPDQPMSDADFDTLLEKVADMNLPDVVLH